MSDQGRWFKLWDSATSDSLIQELPPAMRWAWAAFGVHTKVHGDHGTITIRKSDAVLAAKMGVPLNDLFGVIKVLPNMVFEEQKNRYDELTVTWKNWRKFQVDSTVADRMKTLRSKKRREEKRGELQETTLQKAPKTAPEKARPVAASVPVAKAKTEPEKPYPKPDASTDPMGALVCAYKVLKGHRWDDRSWDKIHQPRARASAKELLGVCGDPYKAHECMKQLVRRFKLAGLSWTFETIIKHAHDWMIGGTNGRDNRTSFSDGADSARDERRSGENGGFASARKILAGIRGVQALQPESETTGRKRDHSHGADEESV